MTGPDPIEHGWWLASRASGIVALVLIAVSVGLGLGMAGKGMRRPGWPRVMLAVHEQTALAGLVAIAVHGVTLLGDRWLAPGPLGILVPFVADYRPAWTGLGILSGHLAALLGLSFYLRKRLAPATGASRTAPPRSCCSSRSSTPRAPGPTRRPSGSRRCSRSPGLPSCSS